MNMTERNYLDELPKELHDIILSYVNSFDLDNFLSTIQRDINWPTIFYHKFGYYEPTEHVDFTLYKKYLIASEIWGWECYEMEQLMGQGLQS